MSIETEFEKEIELFQGEITKLLKYLDSIKTTDNRYKESTQSLSDMVYAMGNLVEISANYRKNK